MSYGDPPDPFSPSTNKNGKGGLAMRLQKSLDRWWPRTTEPETWIHMIYVQVQYE